MLENVDNLNFIASLALYQNRRDKAVGLSHVTTKQKGLLWYYNVKRRELFTHAYYYGVIKGCRHRIEQIKKEVTIDTPIIKAQLLYNEALLLQEQIDKAEQVMNG